jgi:hypothetical protein
MYWNSIYCIPRQRIRKIVLNKNKHDYDMLTVGYVIGVQHAKEPLCIYKKGVKKGHEGEQK